MTVKETIQKALDRLPKDVAERLAPYINDKIDWTEAELVAYVNSLIAYKSMELVKAELKTKTTPEIVEYLEDINGNIEQKNNDAKLESEKTLTLIDALVGILFTILRAKIG